MRALFLGTPLAGALLLGGLANLGPFRAEEAPSPARPVAVTPPMSRHLHVDVAAVSFETYVDVADEIVRGVVLGARAEEFVGRDLPLSVYDVAVFECLKGDAPDLVQVRVAGAVDGSRSLIVGAAPRMDAGEEILLFLTSSVLADGTVTRGVLGLQGGAYRVTQDATGTMRVSGTHAGSGTLLRDFEERIRAQQR